MTFTEEEINTGILNARDKHKLKYLDFNTGFKMGVEFAFNKQIKRFLFIYVDGEYKLIKYIEAETQEKAEKKADNGWVRVVQLEEDMQIVYNGI